MFNKFYMFFVDVIACPTALEMYYNNYPEEAKEMMYTCAGFSA